MTHLPIDPERRRAIDDLFDGALEQPPDQRGPWLQARCSDADIRAEAQALLDAYDRPGRTARSAGAGGRCPLLAAAEVERTIGPYRLRRLPPSGLAHWDDSTKQSPTPGALWRSTYHYKGLNRSSDEEHFRQLAQRP